MRHVSVRWVGRALDSVEQSEWYIWKNGATIGPVTADELTRRSFRREIDGRDFVWCAGMADWLPLGRMLAVDEGPQRLQVIEADFRPVNAKRTAKRILSLSELYIENLERANIPLPPGLADRVRRSSAIA